MSESAVREIAKLPGPPRRAMLANMREADRGALHLAVERWSERYGPIFRFDLGPRRIVGIADTDAINEVLRDRPHGFGRWREIGRVFEEQGMPNVFSVEGADWQRQRRLAVTALNSNHLRRYFDVVRTAAERLDRRLCDAARGGESFDIRPVLRTFTTDVITALAFGVDLNTLGQDGEQLQAHTMRVFQMAARRLVAPVPYWRWVRLPADRALDRSLAVVHRAVAGFIEQARARMAARPELLQAPENMLEAMLAAQAEDGSFSEREVVGNTLGFLLAGEDTTAYTMAWTIWLLACRPQIQARWAREAQEVLGQASVPVDYEAISRLRYGEAVLRESLRLEPVVPIHLAQALADTVLLDTHIPAGTRLVLVSRLAGLRAVSRAGELDPERWLKDDAEKQQTGRASGSRTGGAAPDQKSFLAFGAGPRFCPGRNLAFLEAKCALAMIASRFQVELDQSAPPVQESLAFTMIPKGLRVRLRERGTDAQRPTHVSAGVAEVGGGA